MQRGSIAAAFILAGVLGVGGCQQWNNMWHKDKDAMKEERTSMTALPQPVQDAYKREFPNANVSYITRETEKDGAVHYEFKLTDQSGRKQEVEYDGNGNRVHE